MFITIINDCADANAMGRQMTRATSLFGVTPAFVPIAGTLNDAAQLEASGNLVDILDAAGTGEGVVLVNVAPRNGAEKAWGNGTPFGYFRVGNVLVVTTLSGLTLALPHKLGLVANLQVLDLEATVERMADAGALTDEERERVPRTQFRSLHFLPRVAHFMHTGGTPTATTYENPIAHTVPRVWTIDNFGNAKTSLTGAELGDQTELETNWGTLPIVPSLKDVEEGTIAVTLGSSGYGNTRFAEIAQQGGSAAQALTIEKGASVLRA